MSVMCLFLSIFVTSDMQCDDGHIDVAIYKIAAPQFVFLLITLHMGITDKPKDT